MRRSWAIWVVVGLLTLLGDGGSRAAEPRSALVSSEPPIPTRAPAMEAQRELLRGSPRRAWSAFLSQLGRRPGDLGAAVGLVEAAERTGRIETALRQLEALRRRWDTEALRIAAVELRAPRLGQGHGDELPFLEADGDRSSYVGLLQTALAIAAGDPEGIWRSIGRAPRDVTTGEDDPRAALADAASRRMLVRRHQVRALVPGSGGTFTRRSMRLRGLARALGATELSARLGLVMAMRAAAPAAAVSPVAPALSALRVSVAEGRNPTTYMALAEIRGRRNPRSHWEGNQFPGHLCALVRPEMVRLRADCRLTALEHAWKGGDFEAAMRLHQALEGTGDLDHPILRVRFASLAVPLLKTVGRFDEAAAVARRALPAAELLGDAGAEWQLRMQLASMARRRGDAVTARRWLGASGPAADVPVPVRIGVELERARTAALEGRTEEVSRLLDRAASHASRAGTPVLRRLVALTRVELVHPRRRDASTMAAVRLVEHIDPVDSLTIEVLRGRMAEERGNLLVAREHYRAAIAWVSRVVRATGNRGVRRGLIAGWRQLAEAQARVLLELGHAGAALEALVALEGSPRAALHVRQHLGTDDAVLVLRKVDGALWCWILLEDGVRVRKVTDRPERLRDLVSLWSAVLQRGGEGTLWRQVGTRLSDVLLRPLRSVDALGRRSRITVVAGPLLTGIPFDVLPLAGSAGTLFGDRHVVSRAGSLTLLDAAWHRRPRSGPAVAFGPGGSAAVLAEVAKALERRQGIAFTGPRATETRFVERAVGSSLIHFGGHALAPGRRLEEGGLVLRSTLVDDGLLSYREITALDLRGASVVLLACDTVSGGDGDVADRPDRPATLAEAFLVAGSRSVVGSLWPLSEAAAGEIAEAFYSAGGPEAGPVSLAIAKRTLRRRHPDAPERWAGAVWEGAPAGVR